MYKPFFYGLPNHIKKPILKQDFKESFTANPCLLLEKPTKKSAKKYIA